MPLQIAYPTIPLSGSISGIIGAKFSKLAGLWCPTITSAQVFILGSFDQTSANFTRVQNPEGSGAWTFAAGPGSKCVTLEKACMPFPFLRVETSVVQAQVSSMALIFKLF